MLRIVTIALATVVVSACASINKPLNSDASSNDIALW